MAGEIRTVHEDGTVTSMPVRDLSALLPLQRAWAAEAEAWDEYCRKIVAAKAQEEAP